MCCGRNIPTTVGVLLAPFVTEGAWKSDDLMASDVLGQERAQIIALRERERLDEMKR